MNTYLALFVIAVCSSLCLTPLVRRICEARGWVDVPADSRRVHVHPIPRLGGVAVFVSVILALLPLPLLHNLVADAVRAQFANLLAILIPSALVFLVGAVDDVVGLPVSVKFAGQFVGALLFHFMTGGIRVIGVPLVGAVSLPWPVSLALTLLWVIGITNAFNLIDGVDGLAAGAGLFSAGVLMMVALVNHHTLESVISLALIGAIIGFLRYNFNPASIFLGDSGSLFIGFLLATVAGAGSQKASTAVAVVIPLMAFGVPLVDTGFAVIRRFLGGRPIFEGDREHLHHKLLSLGWSQRRVVWVLYAVCGTFALLALLFMGDAGGRMTGLVLFIIGAAVIFAIGRLQYDEVDELGATFRRASERRERRIKNIGIRRACAALRKARTPSDICRSLPEVLTAARFVRAALQIDNPHLREVLDPLWPAEAHAAAAQTARDSASPGGTLLIFAAPRPVQECSLGPVWRMRIPLGTGDRVIGTIEFERAVHLPLLVDLEYVAGLFRTELSNALLRAAGMGPERQAAVFDKEGAHAANSPST